MNFADPAWAWICLVVMLGLAIVMAIDLAWRGRLLERIGNVPMLGRMTRSVSRKSRLIKAILLVAGGTLLVLSIAGPLGRGKSSWKLRGIDVAVVMDFSKSMMARDLRPSRFDRMVQTSEDLIGKLDADRLAMVLFSGAAVHFPLSHDHTAATLLYRGISPLDMAPGSDLGEALRVARCVLRPDIEAASGCDRVGGRGRGGAPLKSDTGDGGESTEVAPPAKVADRARAIVVFTDGEDTEGRAAEEVELAASLGIHLFLVGVGTIAGELVPDFDRAGKDVGWKKHPDGTFVRTRLDQNGLKKLASAARSDDGSSAYFHLGPGKFQLDELSLELKRLKKGDLDERVVKSKVPIYQVFLLPAFLLLLIETCLGERRRPAKLGK